MNEDNELEAIKYETLSSEQKKQGLQPTKLNELLLMDFPAGKWVVDRIVPHEGITILSGAPATFKTWILLRMAIDIASGKSFLGQFPCQSSNVLVIDEENNPRLLQERLQGMEIKQDLPIYFLSRKDFLVSDNAMLNSVLKICKEKDIGVIFIDSLVRINTSDENDSSQMSKVFKAISQFCRNKITVIITHHERKDGDMKSSAQNRLRGSSDISASVDAHISIRRDKNSKSKIVIEQAKLRGDIEMKPFEVSIEKIEDKTVFQYLGEPLEKITKSESAKEIMLDILGQEIAGLSRMEICARIKNITPIGEKSIRETINALITDGEIIEKQGIKNTKICFLAETETMK
jgi:hypothetical protein